MSSVTSAHRLPPALRNPWAWAIIFGGKDVENRTRNIAGGYRGPVAITSSLRVDWQAVIWYALLGGAR